MESHVLALLAGVVLGLGTNFMLSHLFVFKPYVDAEEHIGQRDLDEIEKILSEKLWQIINIKTRYLSELWNGRF